MEDGTTAGGGVPFWTASRVVRGFVVGDTCASCGVSWEAVRLASGVACVPAMMGLEMDAFGVTAREELGEVTWVGCLSCDKARPEMEAGEGGAQGLDRDAFGVTTTGEDLGVDTYGCGEAICGVAMRGEAICGEVICGEVIVVTWLPRLAGQMHATDRVSNEVTIMHTIPKVFPSIQQV